LLEHTFANLAPELCNSIIEFLTSKENGWTLVAVSKDPFFISKSNKVIVLDEGKAAFQGNNEEYQLMLKGKK
jgi:ABC-type bacteriocin/lantibiotic exporter with double-glycine peptidase domain